LLIGGLKMSYLRIITKSFIRRDWPRLNVGTIGLLFLWIAVLPLAVEASSIPRNGVVREYYSSRRIRLEFRYKNGLLVRKRFWYNNGRLMSDYHYRDGKPFKKRDYFDNGRLKSSWTLKPGILKVFNRDGSLKATIPNRVDGLF